MKKAKVHFIRLPMICNFDCQFCFLDEKINKIEKKYAKDVLREIGNAKRNKADKIIFSGGEPTLIKELPIFISCAKSIGIDRVEIQTNASMFANEKYAKKLKDAGLDSVMIGYHSHKEKTYNALTRTTGYFGRVKKGIKNLFKNDIEVFFNHTITLLNYKDLENYMKFLFRNFPKPKGIFLTFVYPVGECWKNKEIIPKASDVVPYFLRAYLFCRKNGVDVLTPHCGMPGFPLCLIDGKDEELSKIISTSRKNIKTKEFNCINIKMDICKKCQYNNVCAGIASNYVKIYGLDEFMIDKNNRSNTREQKY